MLRTVALAGVALGLVLVGGGPATADGSFVVLYDVDFGSPLHALDASPTLGSGPSPRATPTAINRNPALVVDAYGGLTNQPLSFPSGQGDVAFALSDLPPCPDYRLEMDVVVNSDFRLVLVTPFTNLVHFRSNGDVVVTIRDLATNTQTVTTVATYVPGDGAVHNIVVQVDLVTDLFELHVDGLPAHLSDFGGQTNLASFRVLGTAAAVDDIVVDSGEEVSEIEAILDVRPRTDDAAPLNLRSWGALPVALLGTEDLDVRDVDTTSLVLADTASETGEGAAPCYVRVRDVNGDGSEDLLMIFWMRRLVRNAGLTESTTSLTLRGETFDGTAIVGSDDVRVVPKKRPRRCKKRRGRSK